MSPANAISGRATSLRLVPRPVLIRILIALLLFLPLLIAGHHGKEQAERQASLIEVSRVARDLQRELHKHESLPFDSTQTTSNPQFRTLLQTLRIRLDQFTSKYGQEEIVPAENSALRLGQATLASAERRYHDALQALTPLNETNLEQTLRAQFLNLRADAFYGAQQWAEASPIYLRLLESNPNSLRSQARLAHCAESLGDTTQALDHYSSLAGRYSSLGHELMLQGQYRAAIPNYHRVLAIHEHLSKKDDSPALADQFAGAHLQIGHAYLLQENATNALAHYQQAIEIQTRLLDQDRISERAAALVRSHAAAGHAFLSQGQPPPAAGHYQKALELCSEFSASPSETASLHGLLANALVAQGQMDSALEHYEKAIELLSPLAQSDAHAELFCALALAHNNRGAIRRTRVQLEPALADFEEAIALLSRARNDAPAASAPQVPSVSLDVALGHSGKSMEMLVRTRLADYNAPRFTAVALAMAFRNCGYAHITQGKPGAALSDFAQSVELQNVLVEEQGLKDLAVQFARSLSAYAFFLAACPEDSLRDGARAREYALKACQLTGYNSSLPLEALAAASAETSDYDAAVQWQQKAIDLAPANQRQELLSILELYKARKPYRVQVPAAG